LTNSHRFNKLFKNSKLYNDFKEYKTRKDVESHQDLLSPECGLIKNELTGLDYSQKLHDRAIHFQEIIKVKLETEIKEKADKTIKDEAEVYKKRIKLLEDKLKECAPLLDSIDITNQIVSEDKVREKVQEEFERRAKSEEEEKSKFF